MDVQVALNALRAVRYAAHMPESAPQTKASAPLDRDLYCLQCEYNLRGLSGDPVRCPECGRLNKRVELVNRFGTPERRLTDLRLALHDLTFGAGLLLVVGPVLMVVTFVALGVAGLLVGLLLVLFLGVMVYGPLEDIRKLCEEPGWGRPLLMYQLARFCMVVILLGLWVGSTTVAWLFVARVVTHRDLALAISAGLGLLVTGTCALASRPLRELRRRQSRRLEQLMRITRADNDPRGEQRLPPASTTASLHGAMKHDSLYNLLAERFRAAVAEVAGTKPEETDPALRAAGDPRFGDYQCNVAMSLAKVLQAKPRDIAQRIKEAVEPALADIAEPLEIAGPGFVNVRLKGEFLAQYLAEIPSPPTEATTRRRDDATEGAPPHAPMSPRPHAAATFDPSSPSFDRVGLTPVDEPITVVIDYSQPNIAKQMHVGHLRSTIIGDALARVLSFEGHQVVRQNHIGDWGTQFGMLIRWYREHSVPSPETHDDVLEAIENDYKAANERFLADPQFATEARQAVVALQSGDPEARRVWDALCAVSWRAFTDTYGRLGVLLTPEDVRGESFYNEWLPDVVAEMRKRLPPGGDGGQLPGVRAETRDDAGAVCVFLYDDQGEPLFKNQDGSIRPTIIQKSDGGFKYETTDLAALRHRIGTLGARRILYVVDAGQSDHFERLFTCARAAGFIPPDVEAMHVKFGMMQGQGGRRIKTREGKNIKLRELLDEAEQRALELLRSRDQVGGETERRRDGETAALGEEEQREIARRVGVASVKYADLRNDRTSNYIFEWDKMISFQGNTAPYMMYAYARIRSIYRKAAKRFGSPDVYADSVTMALGDATERALALRLARLREAIDSVAADLMPHTLCTYLYDLASDFMKFYESCPVLQAPDEAMRLSRMRLCDLTARTLKLGLGLLGIEVIERM